MKRAASASSSSSSSQQHKPKKQKPCKEEEQPLSPVVKGIPQTPTPEYESSRPTREELSSIALEGLRTIYTKLQLKPEDPSSLTKDQVLKGIDDCEKLDWSTLQYEDLCDILVYYQQNEITEGDDVVKLIHQLRKQCGPDGGPERGIQNNNKLLNVPQNFLPIAEDLNVIEGGLTIRELSVLPQESLIQACGKANIKIDQNQNLSKDELVLFVQDKLKWNSFDKNSLLKILTTCYKAKNDNGEFSQLLLKYRKEELINSKLLNEIAIDRKLRKNKNPNNIPLISLESQERLNQTCESIFPILENLNQEIKLIKQEDVEIFGNSKIEGTNDPIVVRLENHGQKIESKHQNLLSSEEFKNRLYQSLESLKSIEWRKEFVLAGGAVLSLMHDLPVKDYDFFIQRSPELWNEQTKTWNQELATKISIEFLRDLWNQSNNSRNKNEQDDPVILKNGQSLSIVLPSGQEVQVILRLYTNVAEIITGFDIPFCQAAYSVDAGLQTTIPCLRSIVSRIIYPDGLRCSSTYWKRITKYVEKYHLAIVFPSLSTFFEPVFDRSSSTSVPLLLKPKSQSIRFMVKPLSSNISNIMRGFIQPANAGEIKNYFHFKTSEQAESDYDLFNPRKIQKLLNEIDSYFMPPFSYAYTNAILMQRMVIPRLLRTPPTQPQSFIFDPKFVENHILEINVPEWGNNFRKFLPLEVGNQIALEHFHSRNNHSMTSANSRSVTLKKFIAQFEHQGVPYYGGPHVVSEVTRIVDHFERLLKDPILKKITIETRANTSHFFYFETCHIDWRTQDPSTQVVKLINGSFDPQISNYKQMAFSS